MNKFYIIFLLILILASMIHQDQLSEFNRKVKFLECELKREQTNINSITEYILYISNISREHKHIYHSGEAKYTEEQIPYIPQNKIINYDCIYLTSIRPMSPRYNIYSKSYSDCDIADKDIPIRLYKPDEREGNEKSR